MIILAWRGKEAGSPGDPGLGNLYYGFSADEIDEYVEDRCSEGKDEGRYQGEQWQE